jgi:hypothetical protein
MWEIARSVSTEMRAKLPKRECLCPKPVLAHRVLSQTPEVGLLLPCNVTVTQVDESHVQVSIVDPLAMMQILQDKHLNAVAQSAHERLNRVIAALEQTTDTDMRESTSLRMHHSTND